MFIWIWTLHLLSLESKSVMTNEDIKWRNRQQYTLNYWSTQYRLSFSLKSWHRIFCFMAFHCEAMCVPLNIYLRNEKGRYMGEIMKNYVVFFFLLFPLLQSVPSFPKWLVIWKIIKYKGGGNLSSSKLIVKISTNPNSVSCFCISTTELVYLR